MIFWMVCLLFHWLKLKGKQPEALILEGIYCTDSTKFLYDKQGTRSTIKATRASREAQKGSKLTPRVFAKNVEHFLICYFMFHVFKFVLFVYLYCVLKCFVIFDDF